MSRRVMSNEQREQVIKLSKQGWSQTRIAKLLGFSQPSISALLKNNTTGKHTDTKTLESRIMELEETVRDLQLQIAILVRLRIGI